MKQRGRSAAQARIVTFPSAAQTPNMVVLPLPSRKTAPALPWMARGRQFSPGLAPPFFTPPG